MATYKKVEGDIRIGFLGCGVITGKHAKTLKKFDGVHLYFASRAQQKAVEFESKYNGEGHFGSYEAAIASPNVDVIFIATPPDSHLSLAIAAMKAGKHVIVEKPPFFRSADFDTIDSLRKEYGVQLFVAENYFYKPVLQKLRNVLAGKLIGDIKFMFFNAAKKQVVNDWRGDTNTAGGGALFEGGIHWINFISNLGMSIKHIIGYFPQNKSSVGKTERSMQVVAQYEDGPVGTLLYSWEVNALFKGLRVSRIYGSKGSIKFESNGLFIFVRGDKWKLIFPGISDIGGTKGMFTDFFNALREGEDAKFNLYIAKRDLLYIEQAYLSAGVSSIA
ncbi:Gfo/Idh/MocA family oxidoreductase [Inquilinus sp. KBS0705]|nr:Gfo/Idh/MocA family oxidoreductase [Inquilinus sp. KBS0705]